MPMLIDVGDLFAGVALPFAAAQLVGELAHRGQHLVHVGHHVLAVDGQLRVGGQLQRCSTARSSEVVDVPAREHVIAQILQPHLAWARLISSSSVSRSTPVLGIVDMQVAHMPTVSSVPRADRPRTPPQVHGEHMGLVGGERLP